MYKNFDRKAARLRRKARIRKVVSGTVEAPRLAVYKSLKHIYCQLIDDVRGVTLVAASTMEKDLAELVKATGKSGGTKEAAKVIGKAIAERAKEKSIAKVRFDRGGNLYIGRLKALADAAREAGLQF